MLIDSLNTVAILKKSTKNVKLAGSKIPEHPSNFKKIFSHLMKFSPFKWVILGKVKLELTNFSSFNGKKTYVKIQFQIRKVLRRTNAGNTLWFHENTAFDCRISGTLSGRLMKFLFSGKVGKSFRVLTKHIPRKFPFNSRIFFFQCTNCTVIVYIIEIILKYVNLG